MMGAEAAQARYEAVRHRLPQSVGAGDCAPLTDLSGLSDRFDTFLLDAFGVLNVGDEAIPGAPARIAALQAAGKRVMVLTNAASLPHATLLEKYVRLGFDFAPEDVISSRDTLLSHFAPESTLPWGVIAPAELQKSALDPLPLVYLEDDPAAYETIAGVMFLGSGGWSAQRQDLLVASLRKNPRPVWVGNPDIVAPRQKGFSVEPGFYAHDLADRLGIAPRFFGKPFRNIYEQAFARLGPDLDPSRTIMVGDSLHTDILGAQTADIASALITGYGFLAGRNAMDEIAKTGILPDFVVEKP